MKKIGILFHLVFLIFSLNAQSNIKTSDFKKLDWLNGDWINNNPRPGTNGNEKWSKVSDVEWKGLGTTMKGSNIIFQEKLRLIMKDGFIYYVADVKENKEPVYFKFTELTDNMFSCENPEHDFPKKITYQRDGNRLKATISGNGKFVDYFFIKNDI